MYHSLGLKVHSSSKGLFLHQYKLYTEDLIALASLNSSNIVDTPLKFDVKYHHDEGDLFQFS